MKKKDYKTKKIQIFELQNTESQFVKILKRAPVFMRMVILSFLCTVALVRIVSIVKLPSFSFQFKNNTQKKIIFTGNENYMTMDPMLLKGHMDMKTKGLFVIDTRSHAEYENGHIKGAVNIALYTDFRNPYESIVDVNDWAKSVKKQSWRAREVILYSYQPEADVLRVAADNLRKRGIRAKLLSISYNEWQGNIWSWIAGGELNGTLNINDYIERK